jgi:hypothetical protein
VAVPRIPDAVAIPQFQSGPEYPEGKLEASSLPRPPEVRQEVWADLEGFTKYLAGVRSLQQLERLLREANEKNGGRDYKVDEILEISRIIQGLPE